MTTQTKKFIAPTDIIGLRVRCTHPQCQVEIVLPLSKHLDAEQLAACPICQRPWLREKDSTLEVAVNDLVSRLEYLKGQLDEQKRQGFFSLTLEIRDDGKPDLVIGQTPSLLGRG